MNNSIVFAYHVQFNISYYICQMYIKISEEDSYFSRSKTQSRLSSLPKGHNFWLNQTNILLLSFRNSYVLRRAINPWVPQSMKDWQFTSDYISFTYKNNSLVMFIKATIVRGLHFFQFLLIHFLAIKRILDTTCFFQLSVISIKPRIQLFNADDKVT